MRRENPCAASPHSGVAVAILGMVLATAVAAAAAPVLLRPPSAPAVPPVADAPRASDVLASLPVSFEPVGDGNFVSRGPGYSLVLSPAEAVLGVRGGTFRLRPSGPSANPAAPLVGARPSGATVTRMTGDDPARWSAGRATYGRVEARQVWPGVDMVWHGDQRRLEHDMVVAPGVDPAVVTFDLEGVRSLDLDPAGDLVLDLGGSEARLARPVVYQDVAGERRGVAGEFVLLGPSRIGFRVGAYDDRLPLVIDPTLVTSTFLGGSGNDNGYAIALDPQGNIYVTGSTESTDFPTGTPYQAALANAAGGATSDVFVSKLSADGSRLLWSTYLGGRGRDTGYAVAVGADATVYVSGVTESSDFPRARAAQDSYGGGPSDAFVARISANGSALEWSTFVGGTQIDRGRGLAVDGSGNAYVTGSTSSTDFPAVNAQQPGPFRPDDVDAFLVKVPSPGAPFTFSTRLGGSNDDRGLAVAVDGQGSPYVTGDTLSPGFPTVRPVQAASGGSATGVAGSFPDAFVSKYSPTGSALVYSTFLGGSDVDQGTAIAVDGQGAAYVAGSTNSPNFPTASPLQARKDNDADAFVAKLDPPGAALVYSTYVGGGGADGANGIAVDQAGSAHVVGTTGSANWPTARPVQASRGGADDAFVLKLSPAGNGSMFSTFVGGREADSGMGVAVDARGTVRVLGLTSSADFPSLRPFQGSRPAAGGDAFVAALDLADAAAPVPTTAAARPAAPGTGTATSSSSAHDRRVRVLGALTLVLLLAAVAQTLFLRRRAAPAGAPPPAPRPRPAPTPSAGAGLTVLDDTMVGPPQGVATGTSAGPARSGRTPKARGGPKTAGAQKTGNRKTPARPRSATGQVRAVAVPEEPGTEDGGPPTVATPTTEPPRVKPQEPAIAQLLEEDLWAPEPPEAPSDAEAAAATTSAPEALTDTGTVDGDDVESSAPPEQPEPARPAGRRTRPPPAIPPVPAEELSFWDLFPEDLPPARATPFPVEDLLADHLALPEGPDSGAGRVLSTSPPEPGRPPEEPPAADDPIDLPDVAVPTAPEPAHEPEARPPLPPDAEIVIAELLDGPQPAGVLASADSPWAPQPPGDDFVIDELLVEPDAPGAPPRARDGRDQAAPDEAAVSTPGRTKEEQARIAADRARRRRTRRSRGRGKGPASG